MNDEQNIVDLLYSKAHSMTGSDQKIAAVILKDPAKIVNFTISELSKAAGVSDASVSRFCKNLNLSGFHQLKIQLATVAADKYSYYQNLKPDDLQQSLQNITANKVAELENTLTKVPTATIKQILQALKKAQVVQIAAAGDTYPVAADAVYKFNQLGIFAIAAESWETAIAQTMNLPKQAVLLVISNSGETKSLLQQIKIAQQRGILVIAITNRGDAPISLQADLQFTTAVRQQVLQSEYFFSRVAAMTAIEALFLLLITEDKTYLDHIKAHEDLVAETKI